MNPPSLDMLKPNPDWATLPLFDRTGWKRVRVGNVEKSGCHHKNWR